MTSTAPPGWDQQAWDALEKSATAPAPLDALETPSPQAGTRATPPPDTAIRALCARYDVVTLEALVLAMDAHIERLQSTLGK